MHILFIRDKKQIKGKCSQECILNQRQDLDMKYNIVKEDQRWWSLQVFPEFPLTLFHFTLVYTLDVCIFHFEALPCPRYFTFFDVKIIVNCSIGLREWEYMA